MVISQGPTSQKIKEQPLTSYSHSQVLEQNLYFIV